MANGRGVKDRGITSGKSAASKNASGAPGYKKTGGNGKSGKGKPMAVGKGKSSKNMGGKY